jgi:transposase
MEYIDLRKLDASSKKQVRSQIVRLKKAGKPGKEIEEITGVRCNRISEIWTAYQREGTTSLTPKKSGRKPGERTLLTPEESRKVRETLIDKAPNQIKLAGCLWTRQKISEYVKREYGKILSLRCVSNYLKAWGLTCQRPTKRAYAQDDVRVRDFKEREYPTIAARAKAENAEIYWGDETGVSNTANYERGFSLKGKPPVLSVETRRERVSMVSAITNKGSVRFMVYEQAMTQQKLIDFMRRLVSDSPRKVFLILDNLKVHHGKIVAKWLQENKAKIEVFFLPPYAPEINPDEYLNHALKLDVHSGNHPHTKNDLVYRIHSFMRRLQHRKNKVSAFFRHHLLSYLNSYSLLPE